MSRPRLVLDHRVALDAQVEALALSLLPEPAVFGDLGVVGMIVDFRHVVLNKTVLGRPVRESSSKCGVSTLAQCYGCWATHPVSTETS